MPTSFPPLSAPSATPVFSRQSLPLPYRHPSVLALVAPASSPARPIIPTRTTSHLSPSTPRVLNLPNVLAQALPSPAAIAAFFSLLFFKFPEGVRRGRQLIDQLKVEIVVRHVSAVLRNWDYWKSLDGYASHDRNEFRRSPQGSYPSLDPPNRQRSESRIRDKQDVLGHYRHFTFPFRVKSRTDTFRLTNEKDQTS